MVKEITFTYTYEKAGAVVPENRLWNEVWIDVGNKCCEGVFDHHQQGGEKSSFASVRKYPEYLNSIRKELEKREGKQEIIFHVHLYPDLDCIASVYTIQQMILTGKYQDVYSEEMWNFLCDYVSEIDCGKKKIVSQMTLYAYLCKIDTKTDCTTEIQKSEKILKLGLEVFQLVYDSCESKVQKPDLFYDALDSYIEGAENLPDWKKNKEKLNNIKAGYESDKKENIVAIKAVKVWNKNKNQLEPVKAAVWKKVPEREDGYIFAREDDQCMLTVVPVKEGEPNKERDSVKVALNPNMEEASDYSLRPLAEMLEQYEQSQEQFEYTQTGKYKRNHSRPREEKGRFSEFPFSVTGDPWYIAEEEDMVDAPGVGTKLSYDFILALIENASYIVNELCVVEYSIENGKVKCKEEKSYKNISFGQMYRISKEHREKLLQENEYIFALVKLDAEMLRYNNDLMKICAVNMVGKGESVINNDNILALDYRTSLYADQSMAILIVVDADNTTYQSLVGKEGPIAGSKICTDIENILSHRWELRDIGSGLSAMLNGTKEEKNDEMSTSQMNARIVGLNARMQKDDIIIDSVEQEIYKFIGDIFAIKELKESVTASAELVIRSAEENVRKEEERHSKRLETVMIFFTLLAIFSALVDCFDFFANFTVQEGPAKVNLNLSGFIASLNGWQFGFLSLIVVGSLGVIGYLMVIGIAKLYRFIGRIK